MISHQQLILNDVIDSDLEESRPRSVHATILRSRGDMSHTRCGHLPISRAGGAGFESSPYRLRLHFPS
ncbi:hypothetical protein AG1IA_07907 [Rhizoctonia solani AG-1 IA]|uniref:Uncharacterized protein n=1 Tax=Thanatephorus cucumeris (strain AG1-IA) TaxID=983506 RepID=L8WJG2_THACA|nr:hypothetical protein AG1IA_07907 [Rhizoctonia solani AG-1 IA]